MQLRLGDRERDHDLDLGIAARELALDRGLEQSADLGLVELGLEHAEAHTAGPEHRVRLTPLLRSVEERLIALVEAVGGLTHEQLLDVGEELVQRRVEQAHRDGESVHRFEDADEVGPLQVLERPECSGFFGLVRREDEPLHDWQTVTEEHVLRPAQPDAFGPEAARDLAVVRQVGVGAHAEPTELVGPRRGSRRTVRTARG